MNNQISPTQKPGPDKIKWTRYDVKIFEVQPNFYLKSLWKLKRSIDHRKIYERLTSLTVHAYDREIVKFDISFDNDCHFHIFSKQNKKFSLNGHNYSEFVDEIKFILAKHIQKILQQHPDPDVNSIIIKNDLFAEYSDLACDQLTYFIDNINHLVERNHKFKTAPTPTNIKTK